jgi:hypothetical protein
MQPRLCVSPVTFDNRPAGSRPFCSLKTFPDEMVTGNSLNPHRTSRARIAVAQHANYETHNSAKEHRFAALKCQSTITLAQVLVWDLHGD